VAAANAAGVDSAALLPAADRKRLQFTEYTPAADYFVTNYRWHEGDYPLPDEVFTIRYDDAKVLSVFHNPAPSPPNPLLTDFRCDIRVDDRAIAGAGVPRGGARVGVVIVNQSQQPWPAAREGREGDSLVNLAYRWLRPDGSLALQGRAYLPADVGPAQRVALELRLLPPIRPGHYVLAVEPVQEGMAWFGDHGGCRWHAPVTATP